MFETVGANIAKLDIKPESSLITSLPGQSSRVQITLVNLTTLPDNYELQLEGLPEGWYGLAETNFYLFPRWDATTTLSLDIPPTALPQTYEVTLKLTAQNSPEVSEQISIIVKVEAPGNIPPATPHGLSNATTKLRATADKQAVVTKATNSTAKIRPATDEDAQSTTWQKEPPPKIASADRQTGRVFRKKTTRLDNDPHVAHYDLPNSLPEQRETAQSAEPQSAVDAQLGYDGPAVGLKVETSEITIPAGRSFEQQVTLTNLTSRQNHFEIAVTGFHAEWVHFSATFFNLYPERSEQFYLRIGIPTDVEAGRYRGKLQAQMVGTEALPTELILVIDVKEALPPVITAIAGEEGSLELTAENNRVALAPGEIYEQDISLVNNTAFADSFTLNLERLSENWFSLSSQNFYLFPNWKEQTTFRLEIPADAELGVYPARFVLTSQSESVQQTSLDIEVEVRPANPSLTQRRPTRKIAGVAVDPEIENHANGVEAAGGYWLLQSIPAASDEKASPEIEPEIAAFGEVETTKPAEIIPENAPAEQFAIGATLGEAEIPAGVRPLPITKKLTGEQAIAEVGENKLDNLKDRITAKFPTEPEIVVPVIAEPEIAQTQEQTALTEASLLMETAVLVEEDKEEQEKVEPSETLEAVAEIPVETEAEAELEESAQAKTDNLLHLLFPTAKTEVSEDAPTVQASLQTEPQIDAATQHYLAQLSSTSPQPPAENNLPALNSASSVTSEATAINESTSQPTNNSPKIVDGDKPTVRFNQVTPLNIESETPSAEMLATRFPVVKPPISDEPAPNPPSPITPVIDGDKPTVKMKAEPAIIPAPVSPVITPLVNGDNPTVKMKAEGPAPAVNGDNPTVRMKPLDLVEAAANAKAIDNSTKFVDGNRPTVRIKAVDPVMVAQTGDIALKTEIPETKFVDGNRPTVKMRTVDPELLALAAAVTAKSATIETKIVDGNMPTVKVKPSHTAKLSSAAIPVPPLAEKSENAETQETEENPALDDVPTVKPGILAQAVALVEAEDKQAAVDENSKEDDALLGVLFPGKTVQTTTQNEQDSADADGEDKNTTDSQVADEANDKLTATLFPNAQQEPEPESAIDPDKMMAMLFNLPLSTPTPPQLDTPPEAAPPPVANTSVGEVEVKMASTKLTILPGYNAQYMVTVVNNSKVTGVFEISIEGLPPRYCSFPNDNVYMMPGWNDTFTLSLNVPNGRPDGTYNGKVLVKCVEDETISGSLEISLRVGTPEPETENAISSGKRSTAKLAGVVPTGIGVVQRNLTEEEKKAITSGKRPTAKLGGVLNALQIRPPSSNLQQQAAAQNAGSTPQTQLFNTPPAAPQPNVPPPDLSSRKTQPLKSAPTKKESAFSKLFGGDKKKPTNQVGQVQPIPGQARPGVAPTKGNLPGTPGAVQPGSRPGVNPNPANSNNPLAPNLGAAAAARPTATKAPRKVVSSDVPHIEIDLGKSHLTIVAGTKFEGLKIVLANRTPLPDDFDLSIEGLPSTWFKFEDNANSVNMFPNQTGETEVTIQIPDKVRPAIYVGQVIVRARTQPGIFAEARLEVQVYSPLVVQGRLSPTRAKGYKANYNLILRNSSMSQGRMRLSLSPENPYCVGTFTPPEVVIPGGESANVALKVGIAPKTTSDHKQQEQTFNVMVKPEWEVGDQLTETKEVYIEGNYYYETPFIFIKNHPVLTTFFLIVVIGFLVWQFLLLPGVQTGFSFYAAQTSVFPPGKPVNNSLRIEQQAINIGLARYNPLNSISVAEIKFEEEPESTVISKSVRLGKTIEAPIQYKGKVKIEYRVFFLKSELKGRLALNQQTSDIFFVADNPSDVNWYPWTLAPPDRLWEEFNKKLRNWRLNLQNPQLFVTFIEVEGNTIFLRMERCTPNTEACGVTGANR